MPDTFSFEDAVGAKAPDTFSFEDAIGKQPFQDDQLPSKLENAKAALADTGKGLVDATKQIIKSRAEDVATAAGAVPGYLENLASWTAQIGEAGVGLTEGVAVGSSEAALGKSFKEGYAKGVGNAQEVYDKYVAPFLKPETEVGKGISNAFEKIGSGVRSIGEKLTKATMDGGTVAGIKIAPHPQAAPYVGAIFEGLAQGIGIPAAIKVTLGVLPALARVGVRPRPAVKPETAPAPQGGAPATPPGAAAPKPAGPLERAAAAASPEPVALPEPVVEAAPAPAPADAFPRVRVRYPDGKSVEGDELYRGEFDGKESVFVRTQDGDVHVVQPQHNAVVEPVEADHALPEQSTAEVDVRQPPEHGEALGEGNGLQPPTREGGERPDGGGARPGRAPEEKAPQALTRESAEELAKRAPEMTDEERARARQWLKEREAEHEKEGEEIADWCLGQAAQFGIR